ncbi:thiol:disulfide interchange protein DsbA/DsbL [Thermomonas aquatica]|jgi:thiol:disulfide interchange protein DsbA|uniref:Thiol:disulfide interchange protein DsbA n=1 Tax=Thermomonas aquatica TaxID=2202149 RepID=A0A5B7ZSR4_9GAMM|nr:thiol:disulfide interchange protein DsbA/DsbL [Thermomonas aquatica]QDA57573.1 thiol:disulfide interchange protein DsbA/DsbL [Thermomonas aquatica]
MTSRLALLLLVLLPLAACKKDAPAPVDPAQPPAADAPAAQQASAEDPARKAAGEAAVKAAEEAAAKAPPPVAGTDYVEIANGQPFDTTDGRIEIAEIFGYVCPFCAAVQPIVSAMHAKLPPDVHMVFVPAAFGGPWDNYAKAYYTAEAMGLVDKTHDAMFRAIHLDKTLKGERGMDTPEDIAAFYAAYGADPKQFTSSMASFAVAAKVNRGKQYILGAFTNGDSPSTPTFVVNGKYRVKGKSMDDMFRILNQLVVAERAKKGAAAPAPAPASAATAEAPAAAPARQ